MIFKTIHSKGTEVHKGSTVNIEVDGTSSDINPPGRMAHSQFSSAQEHPDQNVMVGNLTKETKIKQLNNQINKAQSKRGPLVSN